MGCLLADRPHILIAVDCNDHNYVCTLELPNLHEMQVTGVDSPIEETEMYRQLTSSKMISLLTGRSVTY